MVAHGIVSYAKQFEVCGNLVRENPEFFKNFYSERLTEENLSPLIYGSYDINLIKFPNDKISNPFVVGVKPEIKSELLEKLSSGDSEIKIVRATFFEYLDEGSVTGTILPDRIVFVKKFPFDEPKPVAAFRAFKNGILDYKGTWEFPSLKSKDIQVFGDCRLKLLLNDNL